MPRESNRTKFNLILKLLLPKFRYFVDQREDPMEMNFDNFQIQKWILQTFRNQKVFKKMGSFLKFSFFLPELWSLNCQKWCIFCKFLLTLARNLNLLEQFIYIHLKGLIMFFQIMVCFIGVWTMTHEILRIKISKKL